jgi:hypothetical protein
MSARSRLSPRAVAAVLAAGALGAFGGNVAVFAAKSPPPVQAPVVRAPVRISIERLNSRIDKLPELAGLRDGDIVILYDHQKATDSHWEAQYIYHPAGSVMPLKDMYARWRDGLVTINVHTDPSEVRSPDTKDKTYAFATLIEQQYKTVKRADITNDSGIEVAVAEKQVTRRLINEPTDAAILRIPGNAYLFREAGGGLFTTLVDTFEYKTGGEQLHVTYDASGKKTEVHTPGPEPVQLQ